MPGRERSVERASRRGRAIRAELGNELREGRLSAGLTQAEVGRAAGISRWIVCRAETGYASLTIDRAARLLAIVGLDLAVRAYPAGPPLRDVAHVELLARLRERTGERWRWRLEDPVDRPGDLRAWDALLVGAGVRIGVEAETRLRDIQALLRRIDAKRRDSRIDRCLLLVAATRSNRAALEAAASLLGAAFPIVPRAFLGALAAGTDPGGDAIVRL